MRRWLLLLLLFVVPIQLIWAAAAPYCGHESSLAAKKHFGHHEHQHQADQGPSKIADPSVEKSASYHVDCESCHLGASVTVLGELLGIQPFLATPIVVTPSPRFLSHIPAGPERPDRTLDSAAVRFGGGVVFDPQLI